MADVNKRMNDCALADAGAVLDVDVSGDGRACADDDVAADDRVGADAYIRSKLCTGMNNGGWMNERIFGVKVGVEMRSLEEEVKDHFAHRTFGFGRIENRPTCDEFVKFRDVSLHANAEDERGCRTFEGLFEKMGLRDKYNRIGSCLLW